MGLLDGLFNTNKSTLSKKDMVRKKINDAFENAISEVAKNEMINDPLMGGMLVYSAIGNSCDAFKKSSELLLLSGLSNTEYISMVEQITSEKLEKYLKM